MRRSFSRNVVQCATNHLTAFVVLQVNVYTDIFVDYNVFVFGLCMCVCACV